MAIRGRGRRPVYTVILSGIIPGGILVYGRFVVQRPGGNPMNDSRIVVDHVRLETDKPFEEVAKALGRELGALDPDMVRAAAESGDPEAAKARIEAMAGPGGVMLFGTFDHRPLLRMPCEQRKPGQDLVR